MASSNTENAKDTEMLKRREAAIEGLRKLRRPLPPGFKFDREEANERHSPADDERSGWASESPTDS